MSLASVFNHDETVAIGKVLNRIHVGDLSIEMDWNHGSDGPAASLANEFPRLVCSALHLEILLKFVGVHVVCSLIDIDELRSGSSLRNRLGGRNKRVRHCDHHVAGLYVAGDEGEPQSVGTAADCNGKVCLAKSRECLFKSLHHGTTDETSCS